MKRILSLLAVFFLSQASLSFAAVVEDWSAVVSGQNTGTYQDSNGSKAEFVVDAGPKGGQKALKITATKATGGYVGVYHTATLDLSKSASFKFSVKSTVAGDVQMAITDAFKVQYIAKFQATTAWTEVNIPFASFSKDPYYTPPDAIAGHPLDMSKVGNLNFSPQVDGTSVLLIGPIESAGTGSASPAASTGTAAPAAAAPAASTAASSGPGVAILDFAGLDSKAAGTFQDSMGSTFVFAVKDNPNKKGKQYLTINFDMKQGGYCGMWCRAGGTDWKGADLSSSKTVNVTLYSKEPVVLGLALKDKGNNQYVAETPATKGGKWETVAVPLDSFKLDPYYTPPDAVKGAPKDFSKVSTFNIQPKTVGKMTIAVESVVGK